MFFKGEDLEMNRVDDNSFRKVLAYGEGLMNVWMLFEKGLKEDTLIPLHHHEHVQTTYILKGSFKFIIKYPDGDQVQVVNTGDSIYFPSNLEHGCIPLEDESQLLDSFTPIREEFIK